MIKVNLTAKYFLVHVQPGGNTVEHLLLLVTLLMGQLLKCSNWDAKLDIYGCVLEHYRAKGHQVITPICLIQKNCYNLDSKLYIPSTLNIYLILWHTQLIVCAVKC